MLKKKVIFLLIFFFANSDLYSSIQYKIIASVNNQSITLVDLENEIKILKIINKNNIINNSNFKEMALKNLIDEEIKNLETLTILDVTDKDVNDYFNLLISNLNINENEIELSIKKLIKRKILIDIKWKKLINKIYGWKVNINLNEIENKLKEQKIQNISKQDEIKNKLIDIEKNKKINVYSKYHLNKIFDVYLVKYY